LLKPIWNASLKGAGNPEQAVRERQTIYGGT
jgi:hypothetical protein